MEVLRSMFNEDDVGSVIPTSRTDKNRDERKDFKDNGKRQSGVRICLALGLYVVLHICHRYTRVLYLKRSEINLFYIWINSGLVMILIGFYNRYRYQRRLSFLLHTRPLKTHPEISLYALFVAVDGTHSNGFYNTSGGKEVHQLGMAISPLCVIMAALWFRPDGGHTSKIRGAIAMCSILMLILFSAEYDVYIPYHVTVMTAIWAILHGSLLAGFALMAKYYLHEMSLSQIIHSMNLSCVVLLPVVMVLTGELSLLLTGTLPGQRNTIVPVYGIIVMVSSGAWLLGILCCVCPISRMRKIIFNHKRQ